MTQSSSRKFVAYSLVAACLALSLPGTAAASPNERIKSIGTIGLPDKPGFSLRGYRLDRNFPSPAHFVYILEFEGKPFAGTGTSFTQGKSQVTNELLMQGVPGTKPLVCHSGAECEKALARLKEQEALESLKSCTSLTECEKRLEQIKKSSTPSSR